MIANEKVTRRDIPERIRNEILAELRDGELRLVDDRLPGFPELSSFEFPVKSNGAYCTFRFWFPSSFQNYKTLPIEASGFGLYTTVCQKEFYSLETRCILDVGGGVKVYELVEKVQENLIPKEWKPIVETLSRRARELDDQCKGEKELMRRIAAALQDTVRIKKNRISLKDL